MIDYEVKQLVKLQNIMLKKTKTKGTGADKEMQEALRYLPERKLRESKLKMHIALFKELHKHITYGGDGNILN